MKAYYVGGATVVHHGAGSSRDDESNQLASVRQKQAMLKFCEKTRGRLYGASYRVAIGLSALGRVAVITLLRPFKHGKRHASATLAKWTAILKWAIGLQNV